MDHPTSHGYEERPDTVHNAGALQCLDSPRSEREVDGTAALGVSFPRIGTSVIERDFEAASRKQYREQCSREAGTDNVDGAGIAGSHGISRNTSARCSL